MDMQFLAAEKLTVLPKRVETGFISLFNRNTAVVTQGNLSAQGQLVGVLSPQLASQTNNAAVIQSN